MIKLQSFFIISLMVFLCVIYSCTNSYNKENFLMCTPNLEIDREKIRAEGGYSYRATTFEECRSPANYGK